jgi:hypothetical protein
VAAAAPAAALEAAPAAAVAAVPAAPANPITRQFWVAVIEPTNYSGTDGGLGTSIEISRVNALLTAVAARYAQYNNYQWNFAVKELRHVKSETLCSYSRSSETLAQAARAFPDAVASNPGDPSRYFLGETGRTLFLLSMADNDQCKSADGYLYGGWAGVPGTVSANHSGSLTWLDGTHISASFASDPSTIKGVTHELGHSLGFAHAAIRPCAAAPLAPENSWNEADYAICGYDIGDGYIDEDGYTFQGEGLRVSPSHLYWLGVLDSNQYQVVKQGQSASSITINEQAKSSTKQVVVVESPVDNLYYMVEHRVFGPSDPRNGLYVITYSSGGMVLTQPWGVYSQGALFPLAAGKTYTGAGGSVSISVLATSATNSTISVTTQPAAYVGVFPGVDRSFSAAGETSVFRINAGAQGWNASAAFKDKDWLSVSPAQGTNGGSLTVTVKANSSTVGRLGRITLESGGVTKSLWVYQNGQDDCGSNIAAGQYCTWAVDPSEYSEVNYGLQGTGDVDLIRITTTYSGTYRFVSSGTPSGSDVDAEWLNSSGARIGSTVFGGSNGKDFVVQASLVAGQIYYLKVFTGSTRVARAADTYRISAMPPARTTLANAGSVILTGTPGVGLPLTAVVSGLVPANASVAYYWYRNGSLFASNASATYTPVLSDAGQTISCTAVATYPGLSQHIQQSKAVTIPQPGVAGTITTQSGASPAGLEVVYDSWTCDGRIDYKTPSETEGAITLAATGTFQVNVFSDECFKVSVRKSGTTMQSTWNGSTATEHLIQAGTRTASIKVVDTITLGTPNITGTAKVGLVLTSSTPSVTPTNATLSYQWYRGSTAISGATAKTYTAVAADLNQAVKVRVTAKLTGYADANKESQALTVTPGTLTLGTPSITGSPKVGQVLTSSTPAVTPTNAALTYQWYRGTTGISGATARTYTLVAADLNQQVKIRVTAKLQGYNDLSTDSASVTVGPTDVTIGSITFDASSASVSYPITATANGVVPASATLKYQWYLGSKPISGATTRTYTPTVDDRRTGSVLSIRVTASATGYGTVTVASAGLYIGQSNVIIDSLTITGTPRVGSQLVATVTGLVPADATLTYKWRRSGILIANATSRYYTPVAADANKDLTVEVTASAPSYYVTIIESPAVRVLLPDVVIGTVTIDGTAKVPNTLTAKATVTTPSTGAWVVYQWFRGTTAISGATAQTYTLQAADAGQKVKVRVTAGATGYTTIDKYSSEVTVAFGDITLGTPSISGAYRVGQVLTASRPSVTPASATLAYQWYRGSTLIAGATATTYTLQVADLGTVPMVKVTATLAGYNTATKTWGGAVVQEGTITWGSLTITGTAKVGVTLTANPTVTAPTSGVTYTYQWYRGTTAISGATAKTYNPVAADLDQQIKVKATAKATGYTSLAKESAAVTVAAGDIVWATPTITGTYKVGQTLTANATATAPTSGVTFTYQWYRGTAAISGATAKTYKTVPADLDQALKVKVTATATGYTTVTKYTAAATITAGTITWGTLVISGTPQVGVTLTANPTVTAPTSGVTYTYQWYRGTTAISGATAKTYIPVAADLNQQIKVKATAKATGYTNLAKESAAVTVVAGIMTLGTPSITGTAKVGLVLTSSTPSVTPTNATLTYQWYRGTTAISGATAKTYTLVPADYNQTVKVRVTAKLAGYTEVYKESSTVTVTAGTITWGTLVISGTPKVGATLTASPTVTAPTSGVTYAYQWYRGTTAISGATAKTYIPVAADLDQQIKVKATAKATGYTSLAKESAAVTVAIGTMTLGTPSITGTPKSGQTLTASQPAVTPSNATLTYQWYRGTTAISGATAKTYTIVDADATKALKVRVTATAAGYTTLYKDSATLTVDPLGTVAIGAVAVTGLAAPGGVLTAAASGVTPTGVTLAYQWYRGTTTISGATAKTYTLQAADAGTQVKVKVTGTKTGYTSGSKESSPVSIIANGVGLVGKLVATDGGSLSGWRIQFDNWSCDGKTDVTTPSNDYGYVTPLADGSFIAGSLSGGCYRLIAWHPNNWDVEFILDGTAATARYLAAGSRGLEVKVVTSIQLGKPVISGTAKSGSTLTVAAPAVTPTTAARTYQWYLGSTAISGATGLSYTVKAADVGQSVKVRVTATSPPYAAVSQDSAAVFVGGTVAIGSVAATGTAKVGLVLTATTGGVVPAAATLTYQWYRGTTAISGATAKTYTLVPADLSQAIKVKVTGSFSGLTAASKESAAVTVAAGDIVWATPTITGTYKVGQTLTANATATAPTSGVTFTYQWYRGSTAISGATAKTYKTVPADLNQALKVKVTATATAYTTVTKYTAAATITAGTITWGAVTITGDAKVGATLTASVASVTPSGATLTYQWYRGTAAISGATAKTYQTLAADYTAAIKVKVTAAATGYATGSKEAAPVTIGTGQATFSAVTLSGIPAQGSTLVARVTGVIPTDATLSYTWYRGSVAISGATSSSYKLVAADAGKQVWVKVWAEASGCSASSKDSAKVTVTGDGTGLVGRLVATDGGSQEGFSVYASHYKCDGSQEISSPAVDRNIVATNTVGDFAVGTSAGECYLVWVYDPSNQIVRSTWNGQTAGQHLIPAGSRGVQIQVPTKITLGEVVVTGQAAVGYTLIGTPPTVVPDNASRTYQWYRGSTAISGATSSVYTLVAADAGQAVKLRVTAKSGGFTAVTKDSAAFTVLAAGAGVSGQVKSASGGSMSGYRLYYEAVTCPGATTPTPPANPGTTYVTLTADGFFAIGTATSGCYRLALTNSDGRLTVVTTWNTKSATYHYPAVGTRNVLLQRA